ncbi:MULTISPECIES: alpha/beta fold hydrolase [Curtobacterium]|uniref:alpha/beta fold hydrolase n=1 Tax=Curtobacterium flaccumfaciens TaxID=2035 RepID=UPI003EE70D4C
MTAATRTTAIGTAIGAAGTFGLGAVVARRLLFPTPYTATATVRSSAAASAGSESEVTFTATRDTRLPGTYRLTRGSTSVRVGQVLGGSDADDDTVRRQLLDGPAPVAGDWTWDALMHDVVAEVLPGPAAGPDAPVGTTHVVHVHGQSLGPRQVLRGVPVWAGLDASSEIVDTTDLPLRSLDPGAADRIVDRVRSARERGAERVVLQGWSAGALACSIAASRTPVDGLVGIAPLLDVRSALRGAVSAFRLPRFVGNVAARIATTPVLSRLAGAAEPVRTATWQDSGAPTLLLRSTADPFVAATDVSAAAQLGATVVSFATAPHTLEWNEDPERFDDAVRTFAATLRDA